MGARRFPSRPIGQFAYQLRLLLFAKVFVFALVFAVPPNAIARWAKTDQAPYSISQHDLTISVKSDASYSAKGFIEYRIQNERGLAAFSQFSLPPVDDHEDLTVGKIDVIDKMGKREVGSDEINIRTVSRPAHDPYVGTKVTELRLKKLSLGAIVRINYERKSTSTVIKNLFSYNLVWGLDTPILSSHILLESPFPLFFDISAAAARLIDFKQGRLANGTNRWEIVQKGIIDRRIESEVAPVRSTAIIPRVAISNRSNWSELGSELFKKFEAESNKPLPPDFAKIADAATAQRLEDRVAMIVEGVRNALSIKPTWIQKEGLTGIRSLAEIATSREADTKDLTLVIMAILKSQGVKSTAALAYKIAMTDRILLEEKPKALDPHLFNTVILKWGDQNSYFDPSLDVSQASTYLSTLGGSWILPLALQTDIVKLPLNDPAPTKASIKQTIDLQSDLSTITQGAVSIDGPFALELKQFYLSQGSLAGEAYLKQLFSIGTSSDLSPVVRVQNLEPRSSRLEIIYSFKSPRATKIIGPNQLVSIPSLGLTSFPLWATSDRVSDLIIPENLVIDSETIIKNGQLAEEANSSCLALTQFARVIRETVVQDRMPVLIDHIQYSKSRLNSQSLSASTFQKELNSYSQCLAKNILNLGTKPKYSEAKFGIDPREAGLIQPIMNKLASDLSMREVQQLANLGESPITPILRTKSWLAIRAQLRKPAPGATSATQNMTPELLMEYADSILQLGRYDESTILPEHLKEATKMFASFSGSMSKNPRLHRLHFQLLYSLERYQEALQALKNAIALEPNQSADQVRLGQVLIQLGKTSLGESTLEAAAEMNGPISWKVTALQALANEKQRQGQLKGFVEYFEKALRLTPNNPWLHYSYAEKLNEKRLYDQAEQHARQAINLAALPLAGNLLSQILAQKANSYYLVKGQPTSDLDRLDQAEKYALESIKYSPKNGLAYRIAGHAAFTKALAGDYVSLIATLSYLGKAVDFLGEDPWLIEHWRAANIALETKRPLSEIWNRRVPAQTPPTSFSQSSQKSDPQPSPAARTNPPTPKN